MALVAKTKTLGPAKALMLLCSLAVVAIITLPLGQMIIQPSWQDILDCLRDRQVLEAVWLSLECVMYLGSKHI